MKKQTCPNGHVYDQSIYGDQCPLCPPPASLGGEAGGSTRDSHPTHVGGGAAHTKVVQQAEGQAGIPPSAQATQSNETRIKPAAQPSSVPPSLLRQQRTAQQQNQQTSRTVIRHNPAVGGAANAQSEGRKLVGFLVTYNRDPMGKSYNIYEGRNTIGRDSSCDIAIPDDSLMSGKHVSIRYLSGNNTFRFHDEMSSNGTYVNKQLLDDGKLENYDILRVGGTLFIFIAIPQI